MFFIAFQSQGGLLPSTAGPTHGINPFPMPCLLRSAPKHLLLLEPHILQLVGQPLLNTWLGGLAHIALSSSPHVVVLVILAGTDGNIGDLNIVLALGSLYMGGSDVSYSPTASAEGSVSVVADFAFANNLPVAVAM